MKKLLFFFPLSSSFTIKKERIYLKYIYFTLFLLGSSWGAKAQINVTTGQNAQQLVNTLLSDTCSNITTSNWVMSSGPNFNPNGTFPTINYPQGIGVFNINDPLFGLGNGIIISTGSASRASNDSSVELDDGIDDFTWIGDPDIENLFSLTPIQVINPSFLQFDFVSNSPIISFDYIFASEEYPLNENACPQINGDQDNFAIVLIDNTNNSSVNLATIPNTNTNINSNTIHPGNLSQSCPAVNGMLYDRTNNTAPFNQFTAYNGQTVVMTASGNVIPGNSYTLKIVVSDFHDATLDAALFIASGSLTSTIDLGDDINICSGESQQIGIPDQSQSGVTYLWSPGGETTSMINVSSPDTYTLTANFGNGCSASDSIIVTSENCCTPVSCPNVTIKKTTISFGTGNSPYNPGDVITYKVEVTNNEPPETCEFSFDIVDVVDTTILENFDPGTGVNLGNWDETTSTVSIEDITLASGESAIYVYRFTIKEDTLAEEIENCATINFGLSSCPPENLTHCVTSQINQPDAIWPRTYGGDIDVLKRYATDIASDDEGNVYSIGNLEFKDSSNEDSGFVAQTPSFIMKHDYFGNLLWIKYIDSEYSEANAEGSKIKYFNHRLHILTSKGYYLQYNDEGDFIEEATYETGFRPGSTRSVAISLDHRSGAIIIAGAFDQPFTNDDYAINASPGKETGIVIHFGPSFLGYHTYRDHQSFTTQFGANGTIKFQDAVYAEDLDHIFVSARITGRYLFPNGQTRTGGNSGKSFIAIFENLGSSIEMLDNFPFRSTNYNLLEFSNTDNVLYYTVNARLYKFDYVAENLINSSFISSITGYSGFTGIDMVLDQSTNSLFSIGERNGNGAYAKINPNQSSSVVWRTTVDHVQPTSIAKGLNDHYFITGLYSEDTMLNNGISSDNQPVYSYGSERNVFVARLKDNGFGGVFRSKEEVQKTKKVNQFVVFPNPTKNTINLELKNKFDSIDIFDVVLKDFMGRVVYNKDNCRPDAIGNEHNLPDLNSGMYFLEIISKNALIEIHKVIIKR